MLEFIAHTFDAGELGNVTLWWKLVNGGARFGGADLGRLRLNAPDAIKLLWDVVDRGPTDDATEEAVKAWIARRAAQAMAALPPASETAACEAAHMEMERVA